MNSMNINSLNTNVERKKEAENCELTNVFNKSVSAKQIPEKLFSRMLQIILYMIKYDEI